MTRLIIRPARRIALVLLAVLAACLAATATAQVRPAPVRDLGFDVVSAGAARLARPLQLGGPRLSRTERRIDQVYLVRVAVSAAAYDALPPSIEPFLYIGAQELRTYAIERPVKGDRMLVTYYVEGDGAALAREVGAPMVLTIEHGRPQRDQARYRLRTDLPRFQAGWLQP